MAIVMTIQFTFERETKGAVRYQEVVPSGTLDEPQIGTLYLRKSGLRRAGFTGIPTVLDVTVTPSTTQIQSPEKR